MKQDEESVPLVVDNGSFSCKAGFAGEDIPRAVIPSVSGRPRPQIKGVWKRDYFVGDQVQYMQSMLSLHYPIEHGIISDWDDMEKLWQYIFSEKLGVRPDEHPIMLTMPQHNPTVGTEKMAQIMFETFNTPALHIAFTGELSLLASGLTTGLVLDSGECVTHAMTIHEGKCLPNRMNRIDFAGRDLTWYLQRMLCERGTSFTSSAELDLVRDIKTKLCYVSKNFEAELSSPESSETSYELPDGSKITIGSERFRCSEALFKPILAGVEFPGITEVIRNAILNSNSDNKSEVYRNVVLSGGSTMFPGISDRLSEELDRDELIPFKMNVLAPPDRTVSVWKGGSLLGSLSTFKDMWICKEDYDEKGPTICTRK